MAQVQEQAVSFGTQLPVQTRQDLLEQVEAPASSLHCLASNLWTGLGGVVGEWGVGGMRMGVGVWSLGMVDIWTQTSERILSDFPAQGSWKMPQIVHQDRGFGIPSSSLRCGTGPNTKGDSLLGVLSKKLGFLSFPKKKTKVVLKKKHGFGVPVLRNTHKYGFIHLAFNTLLSG